MKCLSEIFNDRPKDLLGTNVYKTLESWILQESCKYQWTLTILPCIDTTSVISKWGTLSLFLSFYF